jgi:dienelactone hydrolase
LRLDSFTARGYSNVCGDPGQVSPGERAQDVFAAAYLLAARPDVRTDRIAVLGLSHGGGLQFTSPEITRSRVLGASGSWRGLASSWQVLLFMAAVGQILATRS